MATVDYAYYSQVYGGGLSEAAFGDSAGLAETHVRWLCEGRGADKDSAEFKRAVCAACEAFAEFGMGQVNGFNDREALIKVIFGGQTIGLRG